MVVLQLLQLSHLHSLRPPPEHRSNPQPPFPSVRHFQPGPLGSHLRYPVTHTPLYSLPIHSNQPWRATPKKRNRCSSASALPKPPNRASSYPPPAPGAPKLPPPSLRSPSAKNGAARSSKRSRAKSPRSRMSRCPTSRSETSMMRSIS